MCWRVHDYHIETDKNGHHFADDIFKRIFFDDNFLILNKLSLKYIHHDLIDNLAALVQIMAWRQTGDRPLSEAMSVYFTDAYMRHSTSMSYSFGTILRWNFSIAHTCPCHTYLIISVYPQLPHFIILLSKAARGIINGCYFYKNLSISFYVLRVQLFIPPICQRQVMEFLWIEFDLWQSASLWIMVCHYWYFIMS